MATRKEKRWYICQWCGNPTHNRKFCTRACRDKATEKHLESLDPTPEEIAAMCAVIRAKNLADKAAEKECATQYRDRGVSAVKRYSHINREWEAV